jgi:ribosome-binding factor A
VATLVKEALADAVATQLKDPRVGFVTIVGVRVSADCTHAEVRVSVLGGEEDKANAMNGLASATGYLRSYLARSLTLRSTPELHFVLDRGLEHAQQIDRLLERLKSETES